MWDVSSPKQKSPADNYDINPGERYQMETEESSQETYTQKHDSDSQMTVPSFFLTIQHSVP